jgi:hypothetical protein
MKYNLKKGGFASAGVFQGPRKTANPTRTTINDRNDLDLFIAILLSKIVNKE